MYRIKTLNKISSVGLSHLDQSRFQVGDDLENEDGILVRSAAMHDYVFPDALRGEFLFRVEKEPKDAGGLR